MQAICRHYPRRPSLCGADPMRPFHAIAGVAIFMCFRIALRLQCEANIAHVHPSGFSHPAQVCFTNAVDSLFFRIAHPNPSSRGRQVVLPAPRLAGKLVPAAPEPESPVPAKLVRDRHDQLTPPRHCARSITSCRTPNVRTCARAMLGPVATRWHCMVGLELVGGWFRPARQLSARFPSHRPFALWLVCSAAPLLLSTSEHCETGSSEFWATLPRGFSCPLRPTLRRTSPMLAPKRYTTEGVSTTFGRIQAKRGPICADVGLVRAKLDDAWHPREVFPGICVGEDHKRARTNTGTHTRFSLDSARAHLSRYTPKGHTPADGA